MKFRSTVCALGVLWAALGLAACGGEKSPDTQAPKVSSTEPAAGASGVPADQVIRIFFDEEVDNQRANWSELIQLELDGSRLYGNGSYDMAGRVAKLSLAIDLQAGRTYQAELGRGVCDLLGNCTTDPHRWSFTIAQ